MEDVEAGSPADRFDEFVKTAGRRLQYSLVAAHGLAIGSDAAQVALAYCWEHWPRVSVMDNPSGYLFRVGQNAAKREYRRPEPAAAVEPIVQPEFEPGLVAALADLTEHQRIAVVLIHGHGYALAEAAEVIDVSVSTVRNHLRRGTEKLRHNLGVENEAV